MKKFLLTLLMVLAVASGMIAVSTTVVSCNEQPAQKTWVTYKVAVTHLEVPPGATADVKEPGRIVAEMKTALNNVLTGGREGMYSENKKNDAAAVKACNGIYDTYKGQETLNYTITLSKQHINVLGDVQDSVILSEYVFSVE